MNRPKKIKEQKYLCYKLFVSNRKENPYRNEYNEKTKKRSKAIVPAKLLSVNKNCKYYDLQKVL